MVLANFVLFNVICFGVGVKALFFGRLRRVEYEVRLCVFAYVRKETSQYERRGHAGLRRQDYQRRREFRGGSRREEEQGDRRYRQMGRRRNARSGRYRRETHRSRRLGEGGDIYCSTTQLVSAH